jgi:quercetin dioxygenase-like cupin family protein
MKIHTTFAAAALALPALCFAQAPKPAVDVLKADIDAVIAAPDGGADRQIKVVDVGKLNVGVGVLTQGARKTAPGQAVAGISHAQVTEVYYVLSGSGILITGIEVEGQVPLDPASEVVKVAVGPSHRATFMGATQQRTVSTGDVVVIPAGGAPRLGRDPRAGALLEHSPGPGPRAAGRLRESRDRQLG